MYRMKRVFFFGINTELLDQLLDHTKCIIANERVYGFLETPSFSNPLNAADAYLSMREH
jgi:hypothetical protein